MKSISRAIVEGVIVFLEEKDLHKSLKGIINKDELKGIIQQIKEHGPLQENLMKRKLMPNEGDEVYDVNTNLEYYPNLILTSIHLADYYT